MIADATGAVLGRRLMGIEAAARYIDATPRTIERLIARGVLTRVHIPTLRRVLVALEDLDRLIDANLAKVDTVGELGSIENRALRMASCKAHDHGIACAEMLACKDGK
jgi:hypothetical protein